MAKVTIADTYNAIARYSKEKSFNATLVCSKNDADNEKRAEKFSYLKKVDRFKPTSK